MAALLGSPDLVIIDTREPEIYSVSHIPGAVNLYDIFTYLSVKENGGYLKMREHFHYLFEAAGVSNDKKIIVYEDAMDNGYGRSCRGVFIMRHLGLKSSTILHGGFQAWLNEGLSTSIEIPNPSPQKLIIDIDNSIIADSSEMLESINDSNTVILDCRDRAEWVAISSSPYGPDFTPRKGRIPNAVWMEWYNTMFYKDEIPWFKNTQELRKIFTSVGIHEDSKVIVYCFKGARTSNTFIAMKMAGIKNVKNYFGSWNEWSRDFNLPIETGYPRHKKK